MRVPRVAASEARVTVYVLPSPEQCGSFVAVLDAEERRRADRLRQEADRLLFIGAHGLLRYALWAATGRVGWRFSANRYGKPALAGWRRPAVAFNLSHCRGMAVCAVGTTGAVGVDVERLDVAAVSDSVAAYLFTPVERAWLSGFAESEPVTAFFRVWTLKEAVVKAIGRGLTMDMQSLSVLPDLAVPGRGHWHTDQRFLSADHLGAVAVRLADGRDCAIDWRPVTAEMMADTLLAAGSDQS
jgi:4'-phosphopantetheinyl transferase